MKTRLWVLIFAAVLGICLFFLLRPRDNTSPLVAVIYVDGEPVRRVDLGRVEDAERYVVEGDDGFNTILIEPGRIRVEEADCPDQICVLEGWLPEFGFPIACLPHNLLIVMEEDAP
ncbi:MAG: NusG domain II-containing protein [Oscillibacter sp.]|nr:NusG domain II-containing protein [Oscillibacter sp.]